MRINPLNLGEFVRVVRTVAHDAVLSPLRRYVLYSIVIHVVVVGVLSAHMFWPKAPADGAGSATPTMAPAAQPAADAAGPTQTPPDTTKATGNKDDYYGREGIETAKPEEIPKNPFEADKSGRAALDEPKQP